MPFLQFVYVMFYSEDIRLQSRGKTLKMGSFGVPIFNEGHPKFWTCIFKYVSFANMWHSLVELRLVSCEDSCRKRKKVEGNSQGKKHKAGNVGFFCTSIIIFDMNYVAQTSAAVAQMTVAQMICCLSAW